MALETGFHFLNNLFFNLSFFFLKCKKLLGTARRAVGGGGRVVCKGVPWPPPRSFMVVSLKGPRLPLSLRPSKPPAVTELRAAARQGLLSGDHNIEPFIIRGVQGRPCPPDPGVRGGYRQ